MSDDPYSPLVRSLFADPRHAGGPSGAFAVEVNEQGVRIRLSAERNNGEIGSLSFLAWGCPHLIAACECACADYEGRPVEALEQFRANDIMQKLSVPVEKTTRILVLEDAVRSLAERLRNDTGS